MLEAWSQTYILAVRFNHHPGFVTHEGVVETDPRTLANERIWTGTDTPQAKGPGGHDYTIGPGSAFAGTVSHSGSAGCRSAVASNRLPAGRIHNHAPIEF